MAIARPRTPCLAAPCANARRRAPADPLGRAPPHPPPSRPVASRLVIAAMMMLTPRDTIAFSITPRANRAILLLDRTDRAILAELQRDGRMPNNVLADSVGLSPAPCLRRVRRLEAEGYIAGYT